MKCKGATIPAPQNIKRREAFLINNAKELPTSYVRSELTKIMHVRVQKKLRWDVAGLPGIEQPKIEKKSEIQVIPKKRTMFERMKDFLNK